MPKLGKDSAWDFFDERLETYTGGAQKEKSRSFCRCTFCGQEWVFRNLYQLQLHLANPIEGPGCMSGCKSIEEKAPAVRLKFSKICAEKAENKEAKARTEKTRKAIEFAENEA